MTKFFFVFTLFISTNVSATEFHKATGTFDVDPARTVEVGEETMANAAYGTFDPAEGRSPASVDVPAPVPVYVVEPSGTFR